MATRIIRFISETQVRLGWVDTTSERILWHVIREVKNIVKVPRRFTAASLMLLIIMRPMAAVPITPEVGFLEVIKKLFEEVKKYGDLGEKNYVKQMVNNIQKIQLDKVKFGSMSLSSLKDSIKPTNIINEINLKNHEFLGGGSNPDPGKYVPLRVRMRSNDIQGQLVDANIFNQIDDNEKKFDAMQTIRQRAPEGDLIGQAILNGDPEAAANQTIEHWKSLLEDIDSSQAFENNIEQRKTILNNQKEVDKLAFDNLTNSLRATGELDEGHESDIKRMQDAMSNRHLINEKSLELRQQAIIDAKKNNEVIQSGVTHMAESVKIKAKIQGIMNDVQEKISKIIDAYGKRDRNNDINNKRLIKDAFNKFNSGEYKNKFTDGEIAAADEDVLKDMKLPPAAQFEINRLLTMAHIAVQQQQTQLASLQEENLLIKAMDDSNREIFNKQQDLLQQFQEVNNDIVQHAATSKNAVNMYDAKVKNSKTKKINDTNSKGMAERIKSANATYLGYIKKRHTVLSLFNILFGKYIEFFKSFFKGKSDKEYLKNQELVSEKEAENVRDALRMYDDCAPEEDI